MFAVDGILCAVETTTTKHTVTTIDNSLRTSYPPLLYSPNDRVPARKNVSGKRSNRPHLRGLDAQQRGRGRFFDPVCRYKSRNGLDSENWSRINGDRNVKGVENHRCIGQQRRAMSNNAASVIVRVRKRRGAFMLMTTGYGSRFRGRRLNGASGAEK